MRVLYLLGARDNPLWRHLGLDLQVYDAWARRIAEGNGLGEAPFTQAPFFPLALGATYSIAGSDPVRALWAHAAAGALAAALAALVAWRWRGPLAGAVAGALVALEKPAIFYTGVLLPPAWTLCLVTLAIAAFQHAWLARSDARGSTRRSAVAGAALGAVALAQPTALALGAPAIAALAWSRPRAPRRRAQAAAFAFGTAAVLATTLLYNGIAGRTWTPISVNAGVNFYIGNNPEATGAYSRPEGLREERDLLGIAAASRAAGRPLTPREASAHWTGRALAFIRSEPGAWAALSAKKLALFFMNLEIPQVEFLDFEKRYSALLRLPLPGFAFLFGAAVAGLVLLARRDAWARFLAAGVIALAFGVAVFFVTARFRLVAVPFLAILAGGAAQAVREAPRRAVLAAAVSGIAAGLLSLTNPFGVALSEGEGHFHFRLAVAAQREGRIEEAMAGYEEAIRLHPDLARAHLNLGALLGTRGRFAEARPHLEAAVRLDPQSAPSHFGLAQLAHATGDGARAVEEYGRVLDIDPSHADARDARASILYLAGRVEDARRDWAEAARAASAGDPSGERARFFLGVFAERANDPGWEGIGALREGDLRLADGDLEGAAALYRRALEEAPSSESARRAVERLRAR